MPPGHSLAPDVVLQHGSALRALASALLRDVDDADEVVQDTWVKLLQRPPRSAEGLGAWLATVVRNLASNRRREAERRATRERDCARREASDERSARERDAALRAVVEAVLALEEPSKTIVMLRYFEGLAPREIGKRLGLEPSVVHGRLNRAHEKLRARLQRELGPDRSWAAMLVALVGTKSRSASIAASSTSGGVWIVGAKTNAWLAATAAAGLALTVWIAASGSATKPELARADGSREPAPPQLDSADIEGAPGAADAGSERQATGEAATVVAAARPWPAPTNEYELEVFVTDENDLPRGDHAIYAAPAGGTLNVVGATDSEGVLRLRWKAYQPTMQLDLSAEAGAHVPVRRISVARGQQRVALRALSSTPAANFAYVVEGRALTQELELSLDDFVGSSSGTPRAVQDAEGWSTFVEPLLVRTHHEPAELVGQILEERLTTEFHVSFDRVAAAHGLTLDLPNVEIPPFVVRGRVLDADEQPVPGAPVFVRRKGSSHWQGVRANETGAFEFPDLGEGEYELRAGGGALGRAIRELVGAPGQVVTWDARLDRGLELKGVLVDLDGRPLADWRVEVVQSGEWPYADAAVTDANGRFALPNAARGSLQLFARPGGDDTQAVFVSWSALAGGEVTEFRVELHSAQGRGSVRVELHDVLSGAVGLREVWMWREDSDWGTRVARTGMTTSNDPALQTGCTETFERSEVVPGSYRIEIRSPGYEPRVLSNVFVAPGEPTDLGRIELEPSARLEFAPTDDEGKPLRSLGIRMLARSELVELHTEMIETELPAELYLREGEYQHSFELHGFKRAVFQVRADSLLRLDPDAVRSVDEPRQER